MLSQFECELPERCCGMCKYYKGYSYKYDDVELSASYGECRRYPPKRVAAEEQGFPLVEDDVWCGEFQSK